MHRIRLACQNRSITSDQSSKFKCISLRNPVELVVRFEFDEWKESDFSLIRHGDSGRCFLDLCVPSDPLLFLNWSAFVVAIDPEKLKFRIWKQNASLCCFFSFIRIFGHAQFWFIGRANVLLTRFALFVGLSIWQLSTVIKSIWNGLWTAFQFIRAKTPACGWNWSHFLALFRVDSRCHSLGSSIYIRLLSIASVDCHRKGKPKK